MLKDVPENPPTGEHIDDGVLLAYARGTLPEEEGAEVEQHLLSCPPCRALQAELTAPAPPALTEWAANTLTRRSTVRRYSSWTAVAVAVAVALLLVSRLPTDRAAVPEYAVSGPMGGVAAVRGDPRDEGDLVFVPTSTVRWLLTPASPVAAPHLRVFISDLAAPERVREFIGGDTAVGPTGIVRFEAHADALLGADFGRRRVHLAISAGRTANTEPLSGSLDTIRHRLGESRWLTSELNYKPIKGEIVQ